MVSIVIKHNIKGIFDIEPSKNRLDVFMFWKLTRFIFSSWIHENKHKGSQKVISNIKKHNDYQHQSGDVGTQTSSKDNLSCSLSFALLQDIERERKRSENPKAMYEDDSDKVSEIKASHFEESMKYTRRSVSDANIHKYQAFSQTLQQSRG